MQTRPFGNTDMRITPIGIGMFAIGGEGIGSEKGLIYARLDPAFHT